MPLQQLWLSTFRLSTYSEKSCSTFLLLKDLALKKQFFLIFSQWSSPLDLRNYFQSKCCTSWKKKKQSSCRLQNLSIALKEFIYSVHLPYPSTILSLWALKSEYFWSYLIITAKSTAHEYIVLKRKLFSWIWPIGYA
jgi:hypothetical protein